MRRPLAPWIVLIAALGLPPCFSSQSWLLAYLAQTATMIVFALSYNLLLGETGLLSFGHAAYAGLGAFAAAHVFNRSGMPLPLLPLVGGGAGALAGVLFGFISTRRAGTAYAMITLGIGELVAASVWLVPGWFGGEGGMPIDRASGVPFFGVDVRPGARGVWIDRGVVRARVRGDVRVLAHADGAPRERRPRQPGPRGGHRLSIRVGCASRCRSCRRSLRASRACSG